MASLIHDTSPILRHSAHWREREGDDSRLYLAAPGQRENTGTVAKQKKLPSAGLDSMRGVRARKIT